MEKVEGKGKEERGQEGMLVDIRTPTAKYATESRKSSLLNFLRTDYASVSGQRSAHHERRPSYTGPPLMALKF